MTICTGMYAIERIVHPDTSGGIPSAGKSGMHGGVVGRMDMSGSMTALRMTLIHTK